MDKAPSAYKHGVHEDDIEHVLRNALRTHSVTTAPATCLSRSCSMTIQEPIVIHAMRLRPKFYRYLYGGS